MTSPNAPASAPESPSEVTSALLAFIASQLPLGADIALERMERKVGGVSRENWSFDLIMRDESDSARVPLIMRRDPVGSVLQTDRVVETAVLEGLFETDVPVPEIVWTDPLGESLGRPAIIMRRVTGTCDYFILNGPLPLDERLRLAKTLLEVLVQLHAVNFREVFPDGLLSNPGSSAPEVALQMWAQKLDEVELEPHPELALAQDWLRRRMFLSEDVVLVHGDFKPGNMMLSGDRDPVLLDWETAHLSDPLEDLGWILNPWRRAEHQIAGVWERPEIVAWYEARTGRRVDLAHLQWWNVLACFKLATIGLTGASELVEGRYNRVIFPPTEIYGTMFDLMEADPSNI